MAEITKARKGELVSGVFQILIPNHEGLPDGDVGLFVCTGSFTKDAEQEARYQERRRIMLVDLKRLFELWVEHYLRIPEDKRRLFPLKPVHFLARVE